MEIFKREAAKTIDDPIFGKIEFSFEHGITQWTNRPKDSELPKLAVKAPESGPTPAQQNFYLGIQENFVKYLDGAQALILNSDIFHGKLEDLSLISIEIGPQNEIADGRFVIEFMDDEEYEIHRVEFDKLKPVHHKIDE